MTTPTLTIRHLCFTGPEKSPALLTFNRGFNVLYGASETGKSFVLEAIDFMLGGSKALRDIPERVGYDRIFLGVQVAENDAFTLVRATTGGQFQLFEGLHQDVPVGVEPKVLKQKHGSKSDSVSSLLLHKIGLNNKRVRSSATETQNLSFRNLCQFCLVSETEIPKQESPIEGGQATAKTQEYSTFKLLLTAVDDSALVSMAKEGSVLQSRSAKIEFIDELLISYQEKLDDSEEEQQDLIEQLEKLETSIAQEQKALNASEAHYQGLSERRNDIRRKLQNGTERRGEISELLARFTLLDEHYQSDLLRLDGIREAGLLVAALAPKICPLCGAKPDHQDKDEKCDGNLKATVAAADAESVKIKQLRKELKETVTQLDAEAQSFDRIMPKMRDEIHRLDGEIQALTPGLAERRSTYADLIEKRSSVRGSLALWDQVVDLKARREALEKSKDGDTAQGQGSTDLSSTTLDAFAKKIEQLLKVWNFPDAERVYFDQKDRDIVINGKRRGSRGKGMRAITHAAFMVGLMEFCMDQNSPHPGFVILDSPLLAYREPDGTEDDLSGTDVKDKFYEYLARTLNRQVLIIENIDPPEAIKSRPESIFFSKNQHQGRYGFFPITGTSSA